MTGNVLNKVAVHIGVLFCLVSCHLDAEPRSVLPLTATDFPPYEFANPVDGMKGFDHEVIEAALLEENIQANIEYLPWKRAFELTRLGKKAGVFSCTPKEDRKTSFKFSDVISYNTRAIVTLKETPTDGIVSLDSLVGKDVRTPFGWATVTELRAIGIEPRTFKDDKVALRNLVAGRYPFYYGSQESTSYLAVKNRFSDRLKFIPLKRQSYVICFSKQWEGVDEVIARFSRGLAAIKKNGTYAAIHSKYQ